MLLNMEQVFFILILFKKMITSFLLEKVKTIKIFQIYKFLVLIHFIKLKDLFFG